jgi:riboflavin transporter
MTAKSSISPRLLKTFFYVNKEAIIMLRTEKISRQISPARRIAMLGMFIALSLIGSFLKIPSPTGTIALDSAPAFLAAILLGPSAGGIVGAMGHLLTALNVGFPLTLPIHLLIAGEMAIICTVTSFLYRKLNLIISLSVALLLNGIAAPAAFVFIPGYGLSFFVVMLVPLIVGSGVNLVTAGLLASYLKRRLGN